MAECEVLDSMPLSPEAWQARQLAPVKGKARFSEQEIKFYKVIISYIRQYKAMTQKSRYNLHKKNQHNSEFLFSKFVLKWQT